MKDKKLKVKKHDSVIEFNNDLSDIQLLDLTDYTAFEVFAHNYHIGGDKCSDFNNGVFSEGNSPYGNWNIYAGYDVSELDATIYFFHKFTSYINFTRKTLNNQEISLFMGIYSHLFFINEYIILEIMKGWIIYVQ